MRVWGGISVSGPELPRPPAGEKGAPGTPEAPSAVRDLTDALDIGTSIDLQHWFATPQGRHLLAWEQQALEASVADVFGFHALQLGVPQVQALVGNRMPHRWVSLGMADQRVQPQGPSGESVANLVCDFTALPFPAASLDLVVLPHSLELAADPHEALREVERVLVPEGRVVIVGFNPWSFWAARQRIGHWRERLFSSKGLYLPRAGEMIGFRRLRDWLRLLGFEVEAGQFGCFRPPLTSDRWLHRWRWMDALGPRFWPTLGAVYLIVAVKRVKGMHLIAPAFKRAAARAQAAPAAVSTSASVPVSASGSAATKIGG